MFNHLFHTYEAVTPPPKVKLDFRLEIYLNTEEELGMINPFDLMPISPMPLLDKPSDKPFVPEQPIDLIDEEPYEDYEYQSNNQLINSIINTGRSLIGGKYKYGGTSPETGLDCSAFLQYIFKLNGVDIPRTTKDIFKIGKEVSLNNVRPGDIICSRGSGSSGRHVQMVSQVDLENNLIYVIEAKGTNYGIVEGPLTKKRSDIISVRRVLDYNNNDPFLINLDIKNPITLRFNDNKLFAITLVNAYKQALSNRGLDPNYAYMLTAQDASETLWGKTIHGNFNYGNITAGKNEAWHKQSGKRKWRDFTSLKDYVNGKIEFLSRQRYRFFLTFSPNANVLYAMQILADRGYDPGNPAYGTKVNNTYNTLIKYLS